MAEHFVVAMVAVPFQIALGAFNTRRHVMTRGEIRFWCVVIFVVVELFYLGTF